MAYVGIDPGRSGAIVFIRDKIVRSWNMPENGHDLARIVERFPVSTVCYVESVHAFPTDGRASAFKFGKNYGMILGVLGAFGFHVFNVTPQKWQKAFGLLRRTKLETKTQKKRRHKEAAADLFGTALNGSGVRVTLKNCDALLIAEYARKQEQC